MPGQKKDLGRKITFRVFFKCQQGLLVSSKWAEVMPVIPAKASRFVLWRGGTGCTQ